MVNMPDNNAGIFSLVCSKPVANPAAIPPKRARNVDKKGFNPIVIPLAAIAAPIAILPSVVRSAISSTRYVMKTPIVITAHSKPKDTEPIKISNIIESIPLFFAILTNNDDCF